MIESIGVDIVDIPRIEKVIQRWGDLFLNKVLTSKEYEYCREKAGLAASVAARFAAKEAVYKALPTEVQPVARWLDIEVINELSGRPRIEFNGDLQNLLQQFDVQISISHSKSSAVAMVVIQKKESVK